MNFIRLKLGGYTNFLTRNNMKQTDTVSRYWNRKQNQIAAEECKAKQI